MSSSERKENLPETELYADEDKACSSGGLKVEGLCPVTGLKVYSKEDWKNVNFGGDYTVTFKLIGSMILNEEVSGNAHEEAVIKSFSMRNKILRDLGLRDRVFVEIRDYSRLKSTSRESRVRLLKIFVEENERGNMAGFLAYNTSFMIRTMYNVGLKLVSQNFPVKPVKGYREAIMGALEALKKKNINVFSDIEVIKKDKEIKIFSSGKNKIKRKRNYINEKNLRREIKSMLEFIGKIDWDIEGINHIREHKIGQFRAIQEAVAIIKIDFDSILKQREKTNLDLRESEERFRIMFESSYDFLRLIDSSGRIIKANGRWERQFGSEDSCEDLMHDFFERIHPEDRVVFKTAWEFMKEDKKDITDLEYRSKTNDGEYLLLEETVRKITLNEGGCFFVINRDITERDRCERENEDMRKQFFHSAKLASIGELAAGVGHEINNPLAIIQGKAILSRDAINRAVEEGRRPDWDLITKNFDIIQNSTERIENMVRGLSLLARFNTGKMEIISCHRIIDEALSLVGTIYEKEGIEIQKDFRAGRDQVRGNEGAFNLIIMNLLSNAHDATDGMEERVIKITTESWREQIIIRVCDNGCGIERKKFQRIFDTFYTEKPFNKAKGLGLSITKSIVEKMGGGIELNSQVNSGTTFIISLPNINMKEIEKKDEAEMSVKEGDKEREQKELSGGEAHERQKISGKVLIVDDEDGVRFVLKNHLEELGLEVHDTGNGNSALDKMDMEDYNFLITDLAMPGMNGYELIEKARKLNKKSMKIVVLSGNVELLDKDAENAGNAKIDGYLPKPFMIEDIRKLFYELHGDDSDDEGETG